MSKELERLELTLDMLSRFIAPTIYKGLKNDIKKIEKQMKIIERIRYAKKNWDFTYGMSELYEYVMFGDNKL